jgi:hypothetical protein
MALMLVDGRQYPSASLFAAWHGLMLARPHEY